MKFERSETKTFGDNKVIRYRTGRNDIFEINASRHGISIKGESKLIDSQDDLESLAECIAKAWQHFQVMRGENGISEEKFSVEPKP